MTQNTNIKADTISGGIAIGHKAVAYGQGSIVNKADNSITRPYSSTHAEPAITRRHPFRFFAATLWTVCLGTIGSILAAIIYPGAIGRMLHWIAGPFWGHP